MQPNKSYAILLLLVTLVAGEKAKDHDESDLADLEAKWGFDVRLYVVQGSLTLISFTVGLFGNFYLCASEAY